MSGFAAVSGACLDVPPEELPAELGLATAPVVGGQEVGVCEWPSTVVVNGCTGTLIHPRVVTTAAHCLNGSSATVRFGGYRSGGGSFALTGQCRAGAQGARGGGTSRDWGYCVIPEDDRVKQIPFTPPLVGCEAERFLKAGAKGWIVGYGTTGPEGRGAGVKREVEVNVNRVSNGTIDVGDREKGACHGDSGGPIYMHLVDGNRDYGVRVFGSTSSASSPRCDCTCSTVYVNIAMHVAAIEENEGIDVTPCTDAEGRYEPGPACDAFERSPQDGTGTFPACSVVRTTDPIQSCSDAPPAPAAGSGGRDGASGATATAGSGGSAGAGAGAARGGSAAPAGQGGGAVGGQATGAAGQAGMLAPAAGGSARAAGAGASRAGGSAAAPWSAAGASGGAAGVAAGAAGSAAVGGAAAMIMPQFAAVAGASGAAVPTTSAKSSGCQAVPGAGASGGGLASFGVALLGWYVRRRQRA